MHANTTPTLTMSNNTSMSCSSPHRGSKNFWRSNHGHQDQVHIEETQRELRPKPERRNNNKSLDISPPSLFTLIWTKIDFFNSLNTVRFIVFFQLSWNNEYHKYHVSTPFKSSPTYNITKQF